MKSLYNCIMEGRNENYFFADNIENYINAINNNIAELGYYCVNKHNSSIWVYKKGTRKEDLKSLICAVNAKNYIDWGPNTKLKNSLETPILNAIKSTK